MEFATSVIQSIATVTLMIVLLIIMLVVAATCIFMSVSVTEVMYIMQTPLPY